MRHVLFSLVATLSLMGAAFAQSTSQQNMSEQQAGAVPYTPPTPAQQQEVQQNLKDVHFAFDQCDLTSDDRQNQPTGSRRTLGSTSPSLAMPTSAEALSTTWLCLKSVPR